MDCPFCEKPAVKRAKTVTYRRGDRFVDITAAYWECTGGCPNPDESKDPERYPVMAWEDMKQMAATTEQAKLAWLAKYGEEMPPSPFAQRLAKRKREQKPSPSAS